MIFLFGFIIDELTDDKLLKLSLGVKYAYSLRTLGDKLNMERNTVQEQIERFNNNIAFAAVSLLQGWLKAQQNGKIAYRIMCKALQDAEMTHLIDKLK